MMKISHSVLTIVIILWVTQRAHQACKALWVLLRARHDCVTGNSARASKIRTTEKIATFKTTKNKRAPKNHKMNKTASFLLKNKDKNEAFSEKIKSPNFVSYFTSQRLFNDITMENYLAMKFVHTDFSVSTLLYTYLLAEQFYYIFWVVVTIISYVVLSIMSANTNTTTR